MVSMHWSIAQDSLREGELQMIASCNGVNTARCRSPAKGSGPCMHGRRIHCKCTALQACFLLALCYLHLKLPNRLC